MRIVQSLWTGPAKSLGPLAEFRGGWPTAQLYWYSWALSCLQAHKTHGRVDLVTDSDGARLLVDRLELPYHNVSTHLDEVHAHPGLWAYGKIVAYGIQETPFIHIDADVYLWKRLPKEFLNAELLVQSLEQGNSEWYYTYYGRYREEIEKCLPLIPSSWKKFAGECSAFCMGIFGGTDLEAIRQYVHQVQQLVGSAENREGWNAIFSNGHSFLQWSNCAIEQLTAYCVFNELNKWPRTLFYQDEFELSSGRARELGYTHVLGGKYRDRAVHNRVAKRIQTDYPHVVDHVARLLS